MSPAMASRSGKRSPRRRRSHAGQARTARAETAELLALWAVDLVLAKPLGCDRPLALLALRVSEMRRRDGRRLRPGDSGWPSAALRAYALAAADAHFAAIDLERRTTTLVALLLKLRAKPEAALDVATHALAGREPIVRISAIAVLANADVAKKLRTLAPLLGDQARVVRMDAARALAGEAEVDLSPVDRLAFEKALEEYIAAQAFTPSGRKATPISARYT